MNFPASELEGADSPTTGHRPEGGRAAPAAKMKFTYPSGARPLEGYTIKRGVGRGGFGEVYFATSDAGKEVALKLIRRNLEVELRGVTQCLNLKHPNLIALYDIRADEMGDQWVVMEYVSGESLEDVIERNPNGMPVEEALWWMRGVCGGVAYLHDHGIVHRDLKPGNIFSDEGTVKIGDYGLAKFISCSRRSGQTESVGTVHYMAPEIANGRYGREIDTYALGIILFEMLTGRVPFEGESVGEVLMKHLTAEPDLSALAEPYRDIVRRALAKDPEVRLDSVNEMVLLLPGGEGVPPKPTMATPPPSQSHAKAFGGNSVDDAIAVARDGIKHAGQLFQNAGERAARASDSELEEPIWKAIRENFSGERFHNMHPLKKGALLFLIVVLFLWYSNTVFSIAFPLLFCYIIYYAIWATWLKGDGKSGASPAGKQVAGNAAPSVDEHTIAWPAKDSVAEARAERARHMARRRVRPSWRDRANRDLAAKPLREKISELLGSMLLAALFAIVAACIAPLVLASQPGSERLATYLWLATVGTLGSWAVLVPSKFVEGKLEDHVPLRIALLSLGALVGLAGWFIGDMLLLKSPGWGEPVDVHHGLLSHELLGWPASSEGANPSPAVYLSYFAFLFLLPRWWRQTECTRSSRLSLWWVFAAVGWAWLLHIFWWFPQPTGLMAAGVIATATQLASPWMPPSRRRALAAEIDEGVVQA